MSQIYPDLVFVLENFVKNHRKDCEKWPRQFHLSIKEKNFIEKGNAINISVKNILILPIAEPAETNEEQALQ